MPRDSNGNYSLPAGNPVVTLTVISSTWANTTLSDVSTALTGSLDRSGQGAMLAGLKLFDGTIGGPGLTWGTETTAGLYRAGAGDFRFAIGGADKLQIVAAGVAVTGTLSSTGNFSTGGTLTVTGASSLTGIVTQTSAEPLWRWVENDVGVDNRAWDAVALAGSFRMRASNDALNSFSTWLQVNRSGVAITSMSFGNATNNPTYTFLGTGVATFNGQSIFQGSPGSSLTATLRVQSGDNPILSLYETNAGANEKLWDFVPVAGQLRFRVINDAATVPVNWLVVDRTGTTVDTVDFQNGTLQYGGFEVGYRNLIHRSFSGNDNSVASDRGRAVQYTGTGGHTFTFDTDLGTNHIVTVFNMGNGNLTIAETLAGTMGWMNGSGTISSGSRTLAVGGVATVWYQDASNCFIWGTGLS